MRRNISEAGGSEQRAPVLSRVFTASQVAGPRMLYATRRRRQSAIIQTNIFLRYVFTSTRYGEVIAQFDSGNSLILALGIAYARCSHAPNPPLRI